MRKAFTLRKAAKGAGAVVLGLIALDLMATAITLVVGVNWMRR
jgi:hypothetical protein